MAAKRDRVADAIRAAIDGGQLQPGDKLDAEPELARKHEVGLATVRAAIALLTTQGYVRTEHGSGTYVRDRDAIYRYSTQRLAKDVRDANLGTHLAEAHNVGQTSSVKTRVYMEFADNDTAAALGIQAGDEILVRDRVMSIGGQPTQLAVSRFPRAITKGTRIEQEDTGPGGVLSRLEDAGHTIGKHIELVRVHRATADEAAALQVPVSTLCLRITRTTTSKTGRALEVNTMTLVDRYALVYEIPAG